MEKLYNDILYLMRYEKNIICNQQDLPRNTRKRYLRGLLNKTLSKLINIYNYNGLLYSGKLYFHPYNTETEEILKISDAPIHTDIKFKKETFKFYQNNQVSKIETNCVLLHGGFIFEILCEYLFSLGITIAKIPPELDKLRSIDIDIEVYLDYLNVQPYDKMESFVLMKSTIKQIIHPFTDLFPDMSYQTTFSDSKDSVSVVIGIDCGNSKNSVEIMDLSILGKISNQIPDAFFVENIGLISSLKVEVASWVKALKFYTIGREGWTPQRCSEKCKIYKLRLNHFLNISNIAKTMKIPILSEFDMGDRSYTTFEENGEIIRHKSFNDHIIDALNNH